MSEERRTMTPTKTPLPHEPEAHVHPPSWLCFWGSHLWSDVRAVEMSRSGVLLVQTCTRRYCRAARVEVG